jgi:hypothetical protein
MPARDVGSTVVRVHKISIRHRMHEKGSSGVQPYKDSNDMWSWRLGVLNFVVFLFNIKDSS